ncbi:MAG: hypothetical protein MI810_17000 [Flavobacteriales bacterium]|nr:hypothetical protein [Flavobacteriales bacterium]
MYYVHLTKALKILGAFVLITLGLEIFSATLSYGGNNNLWIFHIHSYLEVLCFAGIFYLIFEKSPLRHVCLVVIALFFAFGISYVLYHQSFYQFNSMERGVEGILMLLLCILFFGRLLLKLDVPNLLAYPYFWFATGLMIYFSGTLFLFLYASKYLAMGDITYWLIHSLLNILLNIIFAITIWKGKKWTSS